MSKCVFGCPVAYHATKEEIAKRLLSGEHRAMLKYYQSRVKDDPDYLRFHASSTALRLCSVLMLRDFPQLSLVNGADPPGDCCVLEALEEAIRCLDGEEALVPETNQAHRRWSFL